MRKSNHPATTNAFTETHHPEKKQFTPLCHDSVNFSVFLWHGHCLTAGGR
jgi:hypothetical protein